jgi:hypothetical protein
MSVTVADPSVQQIKAIASKMRFAFASGRPAIDRGRFAATISVLIQWQGATAPWM